MKVTVIKSDESVIYNCEIFGHGQSFEVDDLIGKSLIERGYVAAEAESEAESIEGHLDEEQLQEMSYADLKSLAAQMGLDAKGKKEELIARICGETVCVEAEAVEDAEEEEPADEMPVTDMPE